MSVQLISSRHHGGDEVLQFQTPHGNKELQLHHARAQQGVTPFTLNARTREVTGWLHLAASGKTTAAGLYWRAKGAFRTRLGERGDEVVITHLPTQRTFTLRRDDVPRMIRVLRAPDGNRSPAELQGVRGCLTLRGTWVTLHSPASGSAEINVGPEPLRDLAEQLAPYALSAPAPAQQYRNVNPTELRTLCEKLGLTGVDTEQLAHDHPSCGRLLAARGQTLHALLHLNGAEVLITLDEHGTRLRSKGQDLLTVRRALLAYLPESEPLSALEPARLSITHQGQRA